MELPKGNGTSQEVYERFTEILVQYGENVLDAYVTIIKSGEKLPDGLELSRQELLELADKARRDFRLSRTHI